MRIKTLLTKTLLAAAALCAGATSAWADTTVGALDYSTGYLGAKSDAYDLNSDGTWTFVFTNYNNVTAAGDWNETTNPTGTAGWNGFVLNGQNGSTDLFNLRCDNYEVVSGGSTNCSDTWSDKGQTFARDLNGATVNMTVTRSKGTVSVNATITPTTEGHEFTKAFTYNIGSKALNVYLSVDHSYLVISSANFVQDTSTGAEVINAAIDFSNAISDGAVAGTVNSMAIGGSSYLTADGTNNWLRLVEAGNSVVTIPEAQRAGSRDVVTISFKMAWGNKNGLGSQFAIKDKDGADIANFKHGRWNVTSSNTLGIDMNGLVGSHNNNAPMFNRYTSFTISIDYSTNRVTTVVSCVNPVASQTFNASLTNTNPVATFEINGFGVGGNTDRADAFDDLLIKTTRGDYSVVDVAYTVKFVDTDGAKVKDDDTSRESLSGTTISLLPTVTDQATFYNDGDIANNTETETGMTNKYVYKSVSAVNSSSEAITELEAGAIVTIVYDKYNKYDYAVKQKLGDAAATDRATGTLWGDQTYDYYFPKGIKSGDDYYFTEANAVSPYFRGTVTVDNATPIINYTLDESVVYYSEGEDIESATGTYTQFQTDMANGSSGVLNADGGNLITSLGAGIYTMTVRTIGRGNDAAHKIKFYKGSVGDSNILLTASPSNAGNIETSDAFALDGSTNILVKGAQGGGANGNGLDYIIIEKLPSTVSVTVSDAGMATYVNSDYDLDFSASGIKAYKAKVSSKGVCTLTEVANVPAGTPVLLVKDGGATENIPVMTGAAAVSDNDLVAGTGDAVATTNGDYTNMILNDGTSGVGFYFANGKTVAANRAYLHILTTMAPDAVGDAPMMLVFADDVVTGISAVNGSAVKVNGSEGVYNLSGQRVAKPTRGLYIVNGKKVLVK